MMGRRFAWQGVLQRPKIGNVSSPTNPFSTGNSQQIRSGIRLVTEGPLRGAVATVESSGGGDAPVLLPAPSLGGLISTDRSPPADLHVY